MPSYAVILVDNASTGNDVAVLTEDSGPASAKVRERPDSDRANRHFA